MHTANYYLVKDFHCQEIRDGSIPSQYAPCSFSPNCQDVDKKELTNNLIMLILKRCIQQRKKHYWWGLRVIGSSPISLLVMSSSVGRAAVKCV